MSTEPDYFLPRIMSTCFTDISNSVVMCHHSYTELFWVLVLSFPPECSQKHADVKYRAISEEDFVISCDFPSENRNSIFNLSRSYDSQIQWFKALHNWKAIVPLRLENTKHRFQGNAFWFNPIRIQDSGTYICKIRFVGDINFSVPFPIF